MANNKKGLKSILLLLLLILFVGAGVVSASDVNDTSEVVASTDSVSDNSIGNVSTQDTITKNVDTKTVENDKLGDDEGTLADLSSLISNAESGDTITLDKGYINSTDENPIGISKDITIDGNGNTIIGVNGVFNITSGATVTLKNLILAGKNSTNPVIDDYGTLYLKNVTFKDCFTTYMLYSFYTRPSLVYVQSNAVLTLDKCSSNNTYSNSSAIALSSNSVVIANNSSFYYNDGKNGIFYFTSSNCKLNLTNCRFMHCRSDNYGGIVYASSSPGQINIDNCYFENNSAQYSGGVIYGVRGFMNITNSKFVSNSLNSSSTQNGGVIYSYGNTASLYLFNNTMQGNVAKNGNDIYLDSSYINSSVNINTANMTFSREDDVVLTANVTDDMGNSISHGSVLFTIGDSTYTATTNAGGTATVTVNNLEEDSIYNVTVTFTSSPEENRTTQTYSITYGLILPDMYDYTTLQSVLNGLESGTTINLKQNITRGAEKNENNIIINKDFTINGKGLTIDANEGSMFIVNNSVTLTLKNVTLKNVNDDYGALFSGSGNIILDNVTITNSSTATSNDKTASLIHINSTGSLTINNSTIGNITGQFIYNEGSISINNTNIASINNNKQYPFIYEAGNLLNISNSTFANNTGYLGLIYVESSANTITINKSKFYNNTNSNGNGGLIYTETDIIISDSEFINNSASVNGAIVYVDGELTISNGTFTNNTGYLGLIRVESSSNTVTINKSKFYNNINLNGNGVIYTENDITVTNSEFINNNASVNGAIIYVDGGLVVSNGTFTNNTGYLGLIYIESTTSASINTSKFYNNTNLNGNGGAIYTENDVSITNSVFINNSASQNGGAIYVNGGTTTLNRNIFVNNTATLLGSVIVSRNSGTFTLENSILFSNDSKVLVYSTNTVSNPTANSNWWGTNNNPNTFVSGVNVDNWRVMNATFTVSTSDNALVTINVTFNKTLSATGVLSDTTEYLPDYLEVTYIATAGVLTRNVTNVANDKTSNTIRLGLDDSVVTITQRDASIIHSLTAPDIDITSYTGLQKAITGTATGSSITLTSNITRLSSESYITISKNITIDGNGCTIDANKGKIFTVSNAKVILKNMIITKTGGYTTATILSMTNGEIIFDNVTIENCNITTTGSTYRRALIYADRTSKIVINNSHIENIVGTLLFTNGTTIIDNSTIHSVTANTTYMVQWAYSNNTEIYSSIFENNKGYMSGFNITGNLTIFNSLFNNNTVNYTYGNGSAIYYNSQIGTARIESSNFTKNFINAGGYYGNGGAAIYLKGNMTIVNSIFDSNFINKNSTYYQNYRGGAIYGLNSNLVIDNSTFKGNYITNGSTITNGSAIYLIGNATIINSLFEENIHNGTGTLYMTGGTLNLTNSRFINNNANTSAGALFLNGIGYFSNNTMIDNTARNASTMYLTSTSTLIPVNVTFDDVYYEEGDTLLLTATITDDMGNAVNGGTITFKINGEEYHVVVVDGYAEVTLTTVPPYGSSYLITGTYNGESDDNINLKVGNFTYGNIFPEIDDYKILQEVLDEYSNVHIIRLNSNITRDASTENNVVLNRNVTIDGKGFTINAKEGSLFVIKDDAVVTLKNMIILNLDDSTYGSFTKLESGELILINVTIGTNNDRLKHNTLGIDSQTITSVILVEENTHLQIINSTIKDIEATAIVNNGELEIFDSVITNIDADCVIYTNGTLSIRNTTFASNKGDIIVVNTTQTTMINNVTFSDNIVNDAVIYIVKGNATINYTLFVDNEGVLIYSADAGTFNVSNSALLSSGSSYLLYNTNENSVPIADYNWFGSNNAPSLISGLTVTYWVIMDVTSVEEEVAIYEITVSFNKYTDSENNIYDLIGSIPDVVEVTYTATTGTLTRESSTIINGVDTNTLRLSNSSSEVTVKQFNQEEILNFNQPVIDPTTYLGVQKLVEISNGGSTIELVADVTRESTKNNITIGKNITIEGNGFTINANEASFLILEENVNVIIKNMIIKNLNGSYIIQVSENANLTFVNVTFVDSGSNSTSGSLIHIYSGGNVLLNNVSIENFTYGRLFSNYGELTINDTHIYNMDTTSDVSSDASYIIYNEGDLTINHLLFENIKTNFTGIYNNKNLIIDNSEFNNVITSIMTGSNSYGFIFNTVNGVLSIYNTIFNSMNRSANDIVKGGVITSDGNLQCRQFKIF